ncbi:MAG: flagellar basal body rod protein FlgB [Thermoanaerobacteraceae bacterium]|nr:flagellar basal body rod protein FlgB [Thermoanaerobacteraceae bacterium]
MNQNFFTSLNLIKSALDTYWLRNSLIANNIANVDTPDYKRFDVDFSKVFNDAAILKLNKSDDAHIDTYESSEKNGIIVRDNSTSQRLDGNNVDIDKEMAFLAQNTLLYNSLIQQLSNEYRRIRLSINEGRG